MLAQASGQRTYGSTNSQLSQLRRCRFIRLTAVSILRIEAGDRSLPVMFRNDVYRQPALSALRRIGDSACAGATLSNAMPALQSRYVIGQDWRSDNARVREVRRDLAGGSGLRKDLCRSRAAGGRAGRSFSGAPARVATGAKNSVRTLSAVRSIDESN